MGVSPPYPGSISLSIFSGPHCGAKSMRHPEGGDRGLKASKDSRGHPKIHEGLRRAPKVSEVLQRSSEPRNNIQSCRVCSWNVVGLQGCCRESGGMCRSL
jgi:hypothetical protein